MVVKTEGLDVKSIGLTVGQIALGIITAKLLISAGSKVISMITAEEKPEAKPETKTEKKADEKSAK